MPGYDQVNKDFMKDVLNGKKKLLKKQSVNYISVSAYQELSVVRLWPDMKDDPGLAPFFQDEYAGGKGPAREYFFNIVNTVYPDWLQQTVAHANNCRYAEAADPEQKNQILVTEEWEQALNALPFKSGK